MIYYKLHIVLVLVLGLAGCNTAQKQFSPELSADPGSSRIYIYRPQAMANIMVSPVLSVNGVNKFPVKNDHYSFIDLLPGAYVLQLELDERYLGEKRLELLIKPASRYFIKINTDLKFEKKQPYSRWFSMQRMNELLALDEIAQCGYMAAEMPSKYLWSEKSVENKSLPDASVEDAKFDLKKTRNPFSRLQ